MPTVLSVKEKNANYDNFVWPILLPCECLDFRVTGQWQIGKYWDGSNHRLFEVECQRFYEEVEKNSKKFGCSGGDSNLTYSNC